VDDLYGYAGDEFASVTVSFEVGTDAETAKTRVYDKLSSNYALRPYGVENLAIRSIDPEELPQVAFVVRYVGSTLSQTEALLSVRAAANILKESVKSAPKSAGIDLVGGYPNVVSVRLDSERLETFGLDAAGVVGTLKGTLGYRSVGSIESAGRKTVVAIDGGGDTPESLEAVAIGRKGDSTVFLRDVATVSRGPSDAEEFSFFLSESQSGATLDSPAAFLGVSKAKGSNAVTVVEGILEAVEAAKKELPSDIVVETVQNEGLTAEHATNELLFHLFLSIGIVFLILVAFL
jgi:multidrug efflux pump subunit AcrB